MNGGWAGTRTARSGPADRAGPDSAVTSSQYGGHRTRTSVPTR
ncbi:hypothetical protein SLNWT_2807 [Streptomyces albus]|uniref:Uncharacterized protein n=1 Tax=Streptomyces albus (strain ATCC 21838 / DSM 41398 / FERM P-419 / JCM 4703 / NBRC 107858) TaxID=1081613 RepID=A0A0B5ELB4_STRA4|nr:hypothetical protein SLNWT_2807 [Streptomyces albus]AOU77494.1 hypothetical protein SLNHY_2803 [Streptomyces albus]AYN33266.1 hypothetical protein DUI70_2766 [Streptomyces albus]